MAQAIIEIELIWVKADGDCSFCAACDQMIFGKMYILATEHKGKVSESDIIICESCYNLRY